MSGSTLRIATRSSRLALWQANHVADLLRSVAPNVDVQLVHVSTTGDRETKEPLYQFGGAGVFTREVQNAVLEDRADLAVHSLKDLPTVSVNGLALGAVPGRAAIFDAVLLPDSGTPLHGSLDLVPQGARIGTGSPRRRTQLLHVRPDLQMFDVRGNIETRIRKLDDGEYDAIVLAEAGLIRLGLERRINIALRPPDVLPAVSQGALGIECRSGDDRTLELLRRITDPIAEACVTAERRLLGELRAGCHAPLGVVTIPDGDQLTLDAVVLSQDGRERIAASAHGSLRDPAAVGVRAAEQLVALGASRLVEETKHDA